MPKSLVDLINEKTEALVGAPNDFDSLVDLIGDARFVFSHYFHARLFDQFDAVLHYDHTRAVEPLERSAEWQAGEVEETFPSGL
jgi:hypothetical protein